MPRHSALVAAGGAVTMSDPDPWGRRPHAMPRDIWRLHRLVSRHKLARLALAVARRLQAYADRVRKEADEWAERRDG